MNFSKFLFLLLVGFVLVGGEQSSEEQEQSDNSEEREVIKPSEVSAETSTEALNSEEAPRPVGNYDLQDPWLFYKWPGMGVAEGVYGRWPYWPVAPILNDFPSASKPTPPPVEKNKDEAQADEDEEEDEEEEFYDHDDHNKYNKHDYWKKHKPTAVASVGNGPAIGWTTPWGVLHAKVNSRSELGFGVSLEENDEEYESEEENFEKEVQPKLTNLIQTRRFPQMPRQGAVKPLRGQAPIWIKSYGSRPW